MVSLEAKYQRLLVRIAANIKRVRKGKNLSQAAMSNFGFDLRNYQRLEAGSHSPSLFTLHKLSVAFKVPVEEFFA